MLYELREEILQNRPQLLLYISANTQEGISLLQQRYKHIIFKTKNKLNVANASMHVLSLLEPFSLGMMKPCTYVAVFPSLVPPTLTIDFSH